MHLIYLDESGNTGMNLNDPHQPVFVLCALVVPEERWLTLEGGLMAALDQHLPDRGDDFEVHADDVRGGRHHFKGIPVADRIAFRDAWLRLAAEYDCRIIYRAIVKKRFQTWLHTTFGTTGVAINPHVAAFALVARVADDYLQALPGSPRGMFIADENKEIISDVEKSIRILRGTGGALKLRQIVEKGFFIDSRASLPLQLCDLAALTLRKMEEVKAGALPKPFDQAAIPLVEALVHRGNEAFLDVVTWLTEQQKKKRPGNESGVG